MQGNSDPSPLPNISTLAILISPRKSADCERGRRKGAMSKNVKNRQKASKSFSTLFENFRAAPFFRPLLQAAEKISPKTPKWGPQNEFPGIPRTEAFCGNSTENLNFPEFPGPSRIRILGSPFSAFWGEMKLICWAALTDPCFFGVFFLGFLLPKK